MQGRYHFFIPRNSVIREKRSKDKGTDSRQFYPSVIILKLLSNSSCLTKIHAEW